MKYLFDLPPRDLAQKPYAVGLPPEVDAWAKANKHRIGTYRSWCRPQYSVFIGNVDMLQELCNLYDDYGFIAYGNTRALPFSSFTTISKCEKPRWKMPCVSCWAICKTRKRPRNTSRRLAWIWRRTERRGSE